jgi:hypothetical protein|tara:strand:+ start:9597 stop:10073 length:477 start_codon:yes stop_codon:yes gene_type:complete
MALLVTSVFGVTGCGSDDGEAPVKSRIKNSTIDDGRPHTSKQIASYGYDSDDMADDFSDSDDMIDDDDEYEDDIDYKDLIEYDDRSDDYLPTLKNDQALKSGFKLDDIEASKDDDTVYNSELVEYEDFMRMYNDSSEDIIQYEPDGVSEIFAPYIKIG